MLTVLDNVEARILGCLIEKSIVTPDQYPLTLNALTNACNQKSSRDPVMNLRQGEVQHAIRGLEAKHLVQTQENFKGRTERYAQRFCNTRYSDLKFDPAELAIVTLLLLRGPQTPGELRARSGRLHVFADNDEVIATAQRLIERDGDALVVRLPRRPGRRDAEYMHLFSGQIDVAADTEQDLRPRASAPTKRAEIADLEERVSRLEAEVAELRQRLS